MEHINIIEKNPYMEHHTITEKNPYMGQQLVNFDNFDMKEFDELYKKYKDENDISFEKADDYLEPIIADTGEFYGLSIDPIYREFHDPISIAEQLRNLMRNIRDLERLQKNKSVIGYLNDLEPHKGSRVYFTEPDYFSSEIKNIQSTGWETHESASKRETVMSDRMRASSSRPPRNDTPLLEIADGFSLHDYEGKNIGYRFLNNSDSGLTKKQRCIIDNFWLSFNRNNLNWFHMTIKGLVAYFGSSELKKNFNYYLVTKAANDNEGIYTSYFEVMKAIEGCPNPVYKGYNNYEQALSDGVSILRRPFKGKKLLLTT